MKDRLLFALLLPLFVSACRELPPASCEEPSCVCAAPRRLPDGSCCPNWTGVTPDGECLPRSFLLPEPGQTIGEATARSVSIALDGDARAYLVWEQAKGAAEDHIVVAEETSPGIFKTREPGAALSGRGTLPTISATDLGDVVVAFRQSTEGDGGDIHLSVRSPEGDWIDPKSPADRVSFGQTAYEPRLASRPSGETILVWNQWYAGAHYGVALAHRDSPASPWVFPTAENDVLSAPSFFSNAPQIAVNSRGDALCSWYQSPGQELMAYRSERFGAEGSFSRPAIDDFLSAPGGDIDSDPVANPKPAVAEDGRAAVVWTQRTKDPSKVAVYLATRDADGAWTRPLSLDDSLSTRAGLCRDVRAQFDSRGNLFVMWSQDDGDGSVVFLAQRSPEGAWIIQGESPLRLSSETAQQAINPVLSVGRDGQVLVVWSERIGEFFQIAARRGSASGFFPLEHLSPPTEHGLSPAVRLGGSYDRAIVAWLAGDPPSATIKLARVE